MLTSGYTVHALWYIVYVHTASLCVLHVPVGSVWHSRKNKCTTLCDIMCFMHVACDFKVQLVFVATTFVWKSLVVTHENVPAYNYERLWILRYATVHVLMFGTRNLHTDCGGFAKLWWNQTDGENCCPGMIKLVPPHWYTFRKETETCNIIWKQSSL